jgi:hypothetical protein
MDAALFDVRPTWSDAVGAAEAGSDRDGDV